MTQHAIVVGAGLAGSSAAERLVARGWTVDLVERAAGPGQGASGNLTGVLRPLPSLDDNRLSKLTHTAFEYALRHFADLAVDGLPLRWEQTGVLHLGRDAAHAATQQRVVEVQEPAADVVRFVDQAAAGQLAGWPVANGGWWFPRGGWVDPASLCLANVVRCGQAIRRHFGCQVAHIGRRSGLWNVRDAAGEVIAEAPILVLANATDAKRFAVTAHLPLRSARGQVSHLAAEAGSPPLVVVCRLGYVTPAVDGVRCAGATFAVDDGEAALREGDHAENLARLNFILPGYGKAIRPAEIGGRVGFRPLAPDRLPMIGSVADSGAVGLAGPIMPLSKLPRVPGLFLVNGFGARGIVWSALAGELLACLISGAPPPMADALVDAVDPGRFILPGRGRRPPRNACPPAGA